MQQARILLAVVSNSPTPYRIHLHARIARELPFIRLWSVFTHDYSNALWKCDLPDAIGPVYFGRGEHSDHQASLGRQAREWRKGGRIIAWMEAQRINAVVLGGYNDLGRLRLLRWCEQREVPCFVFGDSNILNDQAKGVRACLKRHLLTRVLRRASGALYCGRQGREYFGRYGVPEERMFPFPYEPDYQMIESMPDRAIEEARRRHHILRERRHVMFCGRLAQVKRADLVVNAFSRLAKERPGWDLIVAGDGPTRSELVASLAPEISSRVQFTGFLNDASEVSALYRLADVLVLPSDVEPWGVVVTEAAVCLALICSDTVGAAADLVQDGINGRTFPAGDVNALTEALRQVTAEGNIERMKAASPLILREWRERSDPVRGLQAALRAAGIGWGG